MDYREFATKIRQKYPGSYDDMDDATLSRKIVDKYPQYSDVTFDQQPTSQAAPQAGNPIMDAYKKSPAYALSAPGLAMQGSEAIAKGFGKLGEKGAELLAGQTTLNPSMMGKPLLKKPMTLTNPKPVNPILAAAAGTAVQMTPDIVQSMVPMEPSPEASKAAIPLARRAMGFSKRFLNTPQARQSANDAAEMALKKNVIPLSGNPETMFERATKLSKESGEKIGSYLKSKGQNLEVQPMLDSLDELRGNLTGGASGGKWDTIHRSIDEAKDTISGLMGNKKELIMGSNLRPDKVSFESANKAKGILRKSINYLSDVASQDTSKAIAGNVKSSIDKALEAIDASDFKDFKDLKKIYGTMGDAIRALNNELSTRGNMALSLPSTIVGATGGPAGLLKAGAFELAKRRGAGFSARMVNEVSKAPQVSGGLSNTLTNAFRRKEKK